MNLFNDNIKFMHFRSFNNDGTVNARGGLTVAYYEKDGFYTFAYSRCSGKDNYNRHAGRLLAVDRLRKSEDCWVFPDVSTFRNTMESRVKAMFGFGRQFGKRRKPKLVAAA